MADSKISDLTELTTPDGAEELAINDGGTSKKVAVEHLTKGLSMIMPSNTLPGSRYYTNCVSGGTVNTSGFLTSGRMLCSPIMFPDRVTLTRIGIDITSSAASSTTRLGLYTVGADGLPGDLVLDAGTVDSSTTGVKEITISQEVYGTYYLACAGQGGSPQCRATSHTSYAVPYMENWLGIASSTNTFSAVVYENGVTGAFPATFGTPVYFFTNVHRVMVRVV